jgi:hypothetical protein
MGLVRFVVGVEVRCPAIEGMLVVAQGLGKVDGVKIAISCSQSTFIVANYPIGNSWLVLFMQVFHKPSS